MGFELGVEFELGMTAVSVQIGVIAWLQRCQDKHVHSHAIAVESMEL